MWKLKEKLLKIFSFSKPQNSYWQNAYNIHSIQFECLNVKARQIVYMDVDEESIRLNLARMITNQLLQDGLIEFSKENDIFYGKCSYMANLKVLKRS